MNVVTRAFALLAGAALALCLTAVTVAETESVTVTVTLAPAPPCVAVVSGGSFGTATFDPTQGQYVLQSDTTQLTVAIQDPNPNDVYVDAPPCDATISASDFVNSADPTATFDVSKLSYRPKNAEIGYNGPLEPMPETNIAEGQLFGRWVGPFTTELKLDLTGVDVAPGDYTSVITITLSENTD